MITDFIEFQTNECVSDDKETINRSIQNRVQILLLFPDVSKIYCIVSRVKGTSSSFNLTDDAVAIRNVWEQQQHLYSILYRSVNGLFVIWDALVGLKLWVTTKIRNYPCVFVWKLRELSSLFRINYNSGFLSMTHCTMFSFCTRFFVLIDTSCETFSCTKKSVYNPGFVRLFPPRGLSTVGGLE